LLPEDEGGAVDSGDGLGEEVDAAGLGLEAADGLALALWLTGDGDGDGETTISQLAPMYPPVHTHWFVELDELNRQAWPLQLGLPVLVVGLQYAPPLAIPPVARSIWQLAPYPVLQEHDDEKHNWSLQLAQLAPPVLALHVQYAKSEAIPPVGLVSQLLPVNPLMHTHWLLVHGWELQ
jgi:hypothetical protein